MRTSSTPLVLSLGLSLLAGACDGPAADVADLDVAVTERSGPFGQLRSADVALQRLIQGSQSDDGKIDNAEVLALAGFLERFDGSVDLDVKARLDAVLAGSSGLTTSAKLMLKQFLAGTPPNQAGLNNAAYKVVPGNKPEFMFDDDIFLGLGTVKGDTNLLGHSRGYAKLADGVLRSAHGSQAPQSPVLSAAELTVLRQQGPHVALDRAAQVYGLKLGEFQTFTYFGEKVHFDPKAPYWAGLCHAWSYTSLDNRINALVDVEGPIGERGVWIFGQWISRADLGNWMMGVSNQLSIADAVLLDSFVTPEDLLKGVTQYVLTSGRGLRADLFNDADTGKSEIWNQPIFNADLSVSKVSAAVRDAVVAHARADATYQVKLPAEGLDVKLVQISAKWGAEKTDSWEDGVSLGTSRWAMYMVTDSQGKVLRGYMAHLLAKKVMGLPVTTSDSLPDYIAYPKHALVDAAMDNAKNQLLDNANEGKHFRFFVGTVLARGIPHVTRKAFEAEVIGVASPNVDALMAKYPGIANAYTPAQWAANFAAKLGPAEEFGAVWGQAGLEFVP